MDPLNLIHEAREAGLVLRIHGGSLSVSGPKTAAPIVRQLKAHKAEVLATLTAENVEPQIETDCMICGEQADDTNSNVADGNPEGTRYRRVHFDPPGCYDEWYRRAFGKPPLPANLNRRAP